MLCSKLADKRNVDNENTQLRDEWTENLHLFYLHQGLDPLICK